MNSQTHNSGQITSNINHPLWTSPRVSLTYIKHGNLQCIYINVYQFNDFINSIFVYQINIKVLIIFFEAPLYQQRRRVGTYSKTIASIKDRTLCHWNLSRIWLKLFGVNTGWPPYENRNTPVTHIAEHEVTVDTNVDVYNFFCNFFLSNIMVYSYCFQKGGTITIFNFLCKLTTIFNLKWRSVSVKL